MVASCISKVNDFPYKVSEGMQPPQLIRGREDNDNLGKTKKAYVDEECLRVTEYSFARP